jgi:hypothetical protein
MAAPCAGEGRGLGVGVGGDEEEQQQIRVSEEFHAVGGAGINP